MDSQKIGIVGGGPSGLACALVLAHNGFEVTMLERANEVGGRNAPIRLGGFFRRARKS